MSAPEAQAEEAKVLPHGFTGDGPRKRRRRKILRLGGLLLTASLGFAAGILAARYTGLLGRSQQAPQRENEPARESAETPVKALGRLEPQGGVVNVGGTVGDRLDSYAKEVEMGRKVKKGALLAYTDSHADREAERNLAASQFAEAKVRREALRVSGESLVCQTQLRIKQIEEEEPLGIKAQEAKIRGLQAQHQTASRELTRLLGSSREVVSPQQRDQQELAVKQAAEELVAAEALLKKLTIGHQLNLQLARAQLKTAQADLVRAQAESPVDSLAKSLAVAEARLKRTIICAPADGTILRTITRPGEVIGTQPLLQLGDTRQMFVIAEVYETDRWRIHENDGATITKPGLPGELKGEVTSIGTVIAKNFTFDLNPTADADRRVIEVKIRLDDPAASEFVADRYVNMQVDVVITPARLRSLPAASDGKARSSAP